ncbi:unnamed protein product [Didymodactylos carnosus]|uniref:Penicillin-binding protein transpeptidase domain-containing protein n=1 Tax=Didymodactylos carnosus TaxID=1234261 RepID=A0A814MR37_9BILA|nr:unnamed protein product [Didymodactylos carnosus]CAF1196021.1 unnamed protein product [Didymodactylos carnosus]CAF3848600.1 unnamed protein product [Didymodactylos carnosus]CAF4006242.1 unnamed protein product [Didymodactylos carnosus]
MAGLERAYEQFLTNSDPDRSREEQLNKPLELTIDVRLQNILNEEIERTAKEFSAKGAVGIIANPNNGEILAFVSKPDFDPHYPNLAKPEELFNMASLGIYEMGSVFKALTMAVAFDVNCITMNDAYDTSYLKVGGFNIKDTHYIPGWHSVSEIFLHSSNTGATQIIFEVGKQQFKEYLKKLGLLDQLKIEIPERGTPLFPSDKRWSDLTTAIMSYGYGLSVIYPTKDQYVSQAASVQVKTEEVEGAAEECVKKEALDDTHDSVVTGATSSGGEDLATDSLMSEVPVIGADNIS